MSDTYTLVLTCYRSGQMSERQWQEHLKDDAFRTWINSHKIPGTERVVGGAR